MKYTLLAIECGLEKMKQKLKIVLTREKEEKKVGDEMSEESSEDDETEKNLKERR